MSRKITALGLLASVLGFSAVGAYIYSKFTGRWTGEFTGLPPGLGISPVAPGPAAQLTPQQLLESAHNMPVIFGAPEPLLTPLTEGATGQVFNWQGLAPGVIPEPYPESYFAPVPTPVIQQAWVIPGAFFHINDKIGVVPGKETITILYVDDEKREYGIAIQTPWSYFQDVRNIDQFDAQYKTYAHWS